MVLHVIYRHSYKMSINRPPNLLSHLEIVWHPILQKKWKIWTIPKCWMVWFPDTHQKVLLPCQDHRVWLRGLLAIARQCSLPMYLPHFHFWMRRVWQHAAALCGVTENENSYELPVCIRLAAKQPVFLLWNAIVTLLRRRAQCVAVDTTTRRHWILMWCHCRKRWHCWIPPITQYCLSREVRLICCDLLYS